MGIDPHGPGLSERMEVRKAVTRSKTKTEQVRDLAKFTQKLGGKLGAAGDLAVQVMLMMEVGRWLVRSWKAKKRD
jgi:hypothetical protein